MAFSSQWGDLQLGNAQLGGFLDLGPPPTFTSINPTSGSAGGGTSFTITGSDFVDGATVNFDGIAATGVVFVNSTTITGTTPAHVTGFSNVTIKNPDGQTDTLTNAFEFIGSVVPVPAPVLGAAGRPVMGLVQIDFPGNTQRASLLGAHDTTNYWEARVVSFGTTSREITPLPGEFRVSEAEVELNNADGKWSQLRAQVPFSNRVAKILIGDPAEGESSFQVIFTGRIRSWQITSEVCRLTFSDVFSERLDRTIVGAINEQLFPHLPAETPRLLMPVILGNISTAGGTNLGAVPALLVDPAVGQSKYRYVAGQGVLKLIQNIYKYGVIVSSGFTVQDIPSPLGDGSQITVIDFDSDQRDSSRSNEHEITIDVVGLTDDGTTIGNSIEAPSEQLKAVLLRNGFVADDLDSLSFTNAKVITDTAGIRGSVVLLDPDLTLRDVLEKFSQSFNLTVGSNPLGKLQAIIPSGSVATAGIIDELTDELHILKGSLSIEGQEETASTLRAFWAKDWARDQWEQTDDTTDFEQIGALGKDIVSQVELEYVRDPLTKARIVTDRLFFMKEQRQIVSITVEPLLYKILEIGNDIAVTHYAGTEAAGAGYQQTFFRVLGIGFTIEEDGVKMLLRLIDLSTAIVFSSSSEFKQFAGALDPVGVEAPLFYTTRRSQLARENNVPSYPYHRPA